MPSKFLIFKIGLGVGLSKEKPPLEEVV